MSRRKKKRILEGLQHITCSEMVDKISKDYGIETKIKVQQKFEDFPVVNGRRRISASYHSVIVDREGNEHPYMLSPDKRNNQRLADFDHIYLLTKKGLSQVKTEAGIELDHEPCRICEGGGWTSQGTRVFYNEFYCEA